MASDYTEREYDDDVYEDEYYEEHYNEEELIDDEFHLDEDEGEWEEKKISLSFACEDCDYRWDDVIVRRRNAYEDEDDMLDLMCPMCGSQNVNQI